MLTPAGSKCRIVRRNAGAMREGIARRPLRSPPCSEMCDERANAPLRH
jgi:hypothetical protein